MLMMRDVALCRTRLMHTAGSSVASVHTHGLVVKPETNSHNRSCKACQVFLCQLHSHTKVQLLQLAAAAKQQADASHSTISDVNSKATQLPSTQ
jgi:hypothetical protein